MTNSVIVSIDISKGDRAVMIVGAKNGESMKIVNAFTDEEAKDLWKKLTTPPKGVLER